ncbi:MAG: metallophosphoesterase [Lentisphaeria bacterium]|nr:metallophosphoesterase [Lentisphaeria bacterium]
MLFSDTHYDNPSVRTKIPDAKDPEYKGRELKRNLDAWAERMPAEIENAKSLANGLNAKFAVHLGDMIQGDCENSWLYNKSYQQIVSKLTEGLNMPLYIVRGNHDSRGKGGPAAYNSSIIPYNELVHHKKAQGAGKNNFVEMVEGDLHVFYDCLNGKVDYILDALDKHPEARHVFVYTHYPLIPYHAGTIGGGVVSAIEDVTKRLELVVKLAMRHAIVFCGHLHKAYCIVMTIPEGTITQLSLFTLHTHAEGVQPVAVEHPSPTECFRLPETEAPAKKKTLDASMRKTFDGAYSRITDYVPAGGSFDMITVDGDKVYAKMYFGTAKEAAFEIRLK